jgi:D-alanyl-lipoteichoic acid acyltransferase DltB (MBOAT superfamily)
VLFHSYQYMLFLPIVFGLYWSVAGHASLRKLLLLIASALFYMAWSPAPFFLVVYLATVDYFLARGMAKWKDNEKRKKLLLTLSVVNNLAVLGTFKYANMALETVSTIAGWVGVSVTFQRLDLLLPIGLSFVVFHTLSYTIDVYRGDCEPRRSWVDVLLYISFFPQLIAGPILRAHSFLPQFDKDPKLSSEEGAVALLRIAKGLVKKLLIADLLAANIIDRVFASPSVYTAPEIWTAVFAYTMEIYYDFSAYSDIAIGSAALFGFKIPENFNRPYKSTDLTQFWRRWHISLSTWLRDYLYIPLGGNRNGFVMTLRNVMITMILGGIWHGASWRMALWGGVHGVGLCLTRIFWRAFGEPEEGKTPLWRTGLAWFVTFMVVMLARIFFRASSMQNAYAVLNGMVGSEMHAPNVTPQVLAVLGIATAIHFSPDDLFKRVANVYVRLPILARAAALVAIALVVKQIASFEVQPFIYFQF